MHRSGGTTDFLYCIPFLLMFVSELDTGSRAAYQNRSSHEVVHRLYGACVRFKTKVKILCGTSLLNQMFRESFFSCVTAILGYTTLHQDKRSGLAFWASGASFIGWVPLRRLRIIFLRHVAMALYWNSALLPLSNPSELFPSTRKSGRFCSRRIKVPSSRLRCLGRVELTIV